MANEVRRKDGSENSITINLNSLADGAGRSSASISNSTDQPAAIITLQVRSGSTAHDAGSVCRVYLLRDTGTLATDGWAGSDASFTPVNAPLLGTIELTTSTNTDFRRDFDTTKMGPLGPTWGIAVYNDTGQALQTSGHLKYYFYHVSEVQ